MILKSSHQDLSNEVSHFIECSVHIYRRPWYMGQRRYPAVNAYRFLPKNMPKNANHCFAQSDQQDTHIHARAHATQCHIATVLIVALALSVSDNVIDAGTKGQSIVSCMQKWARDSPLASYGLTSKYCLPQLCCSRMNMYVFVLGAVRKRRRNFLAFFVTPPPPCRNSDPDLTNFYLLISCNIQFNLKF